ncbi:ABC transporter ATP-binding protein, partial [bacterium]
QGDAHVNGRISALLELGAGFNPEFTGRENILMNYRVQGLKDKDIKKRLPEVESFADIGKFMDQPVKTYSSGMFVRLAFASAINVDPDILIIDEALSVGDAKFQHKCFNKFIEFQQKGKTIIFVSHDTNTIVRHCDEAILLEKGEILEKGHPKNITNYYLDLLFTGKISGYEIAPLLVYENYKGFNIVHYKTKYFGLSQVLGPVDISNINEEQIQKYTEDKECVVGLSLDAAKDLIDKIVPDTDFSEQGDIKNQEETLEMFLNNTNEQDNCINRKSYNKNEYRSSDNRAEIIDYFLVTNETRDFLRMNTGDTLDIYIKVRFDHFVENPLFGIAIKTTEGINIYGTNTRLTNTEVLKTSKSDIIVFKISVQLDVCPGDYFLDLGVAEKLEDKDMPIDVRYSLVHLIVHPKDYWFDGYVDLKAGFEEVSRKSVALMNV